MIEYTTQDSERSASNNLWKTAAGLGLSFVAFAAFQGPLSGLTKAVSQRAGLLMRSFSPTFRTAWSNAARTIGREEAAALAGKSMHQPAKGVEKFLSTFGNAKFQQEVTAAGVKELPGPMRVLNQWAQIKSPTWGSAYQSAVGELANFEAAHAPNSKWFRSALRNKSVNRDLLREEFQLKYAKDFFAKSGREKRIVGAGIKWFGAYAATAPAFYLADKATGLLTGQGEEGRKKRSAWNIPGKLWDFTKWSVGFAPADMVFRGAGSALKLAKARGVQSANKFFSTTEGQKISSELLSGLNKGKQFVQQVLGATIRPLHHANMAYMAEVSRPKPRGSTFFGGVVHNATQGIKGAVAGARMAKTQFDIARRGGVAPVRTAGSRFTDQVIETVAGMHAQSAGIGFKPSGRGMSVDELRENMGKALAQTFNVGAPSHRANFLEKVLALRPKIMRRSDLNSFIDRAEAGSAQVGMYNLKSSQQLFGGRDTFRMTGLYEQGDISWLNRKTITQKLATTALKFAIHIPFTNKIVNPAQFFHVHDLLEPNYLLDANRSRIALPNPEDLPESTRDSLMMGFAKEGGTRNRWAVLPADLVKNKDMTPEHKALEWLTNWKSKFKGPTDVDTAQNIKTAQSNWLRHNNVVEAGIIDPVVGQSEKIVSTFSLVGGGRSSLAVGGNLFYTDTYGNMTRVAGYKATPVQNRYVQIMSNMLYPAGPGAAFKDHDQVVREQNLSPWGAVKDKIYRRLELGPYANKEQAQGIFAPKTMWRNLTDRKSYRNTFGAEPSTAAEKDFAMEELGRQFGISGFTKKTGMPAHYPGLVPIVDNKNAIGILQQRYGGVQTGNAVIDQHTLTSIASDPFTAAQVLLEQARDGQYVPGVMKKFAQDVLTNRNLAAVRESGMATKGQLLRSAALANRLEQINVPLDQVLGDQIPEALRPYLKFSAINKELDSIIQGRNPAVVATKVKARFMDILKSQEERGMMHEIEQQRSLFDLGSAGSFANDYLSGNFNKLKLAPLLLSPEQLRPSFGSVLAPTAGNMTAGAVGTRYMAERAAGFFGVRTDTSANSAAIFGKIISHRVLPVAGAALAYRLADAFTDENPLFAGTMLDEGIGVAAAEQVAKAHLLSSRILDASGLTQLSKYTEGLLPGSVNSPLFRAARTIGLPVAGYMLGGRGGNLGGAKRGMLAGLVADAALGFGLTDLTKAHDELVEEYSGRQDVAVRKNRFWEFGKGPFGGGQIDYYRPNWFARVKSQHQATADQYGSKWESLLFQPLPLLDIAPGSFIAPHYYARKHYLSRPYPTTGSPGSEAAIIGPVLGKSLSFLSDVSSMHQSEMESINRGYGGGDGAGGPSLGIGGVGFDGTGGGIASSGQFSQVAGKQFYYGITEPMGLFGWAGSLAAGGQTTALSNPYEMATSGSMTSQSRKFWNLNLGGGFLMTEGVRRLMPRKLAEIKEINPLSNNQADWLPERFRCISGDTVVEVNGSTPVKASSILPGTCIRNKQGALVQVTAVAQRNMDAAEKLYAIKVGSLPGFEHKISEEHPLWTPDGWKQIKDISIGDYVGYPVPSLETLFYSSGPVLDLSNYINPDAATVTAQWIYPHKADNLYTLVEYMETHDILYWGKGQCKKVCEELGIPWRGPCFGAEGRCALLSLGSRNLRRIPRFLNIDTEQFGTIQGFYASEGSGLRTAAFSLNHNEQIYAEQIKQAFLDIGWATPMKWYADSRVLPAEKCVGGRYLGRPSNGRTAVFCSRVIATILSNLLGRGCANKRLLLTSNNWKTTLAALINGDGFYSVVNNTARLGLKQAHNKAILYQVWQVLLANNIVGSINTTGLDYKGYQAEKVASLISLHKAMDKPLGSHRRKSETLGNGHWYIENKYWFSKLAKKQEVPQELLYSITISVGSSFCLPGLATHNTGDPFTSVNEGELRLPGTGYESMHSVEHTFPGRSSMVGYDVNTMVAKMLGIAPPMDEEGFEVTSQGTAMHRKIQADLMARNIAIKAEANTYDPYADVSGTIDLILQGGAVGEIKTKSRTALQKLTAPSQTHLSQINLYLHTTKARKGYLIYAAREDSNMRKVFEVNYSKARYQKDAAKLREARTIASQLIDTVPTTHGASYSHVDRLSILGDLAPTSDEYYKELGIATDLKRRGMMSPEQQAKYETTLGHRQSALRVGEMYPTRFKGNLMSPATTYDLMSENTNIKAASEYNLAERAVGAAWEGLQNVSSPVSSKFFNYPTPSEAYRRAVIYDNLHQNWGTPYESFVEPYGKSFMSSTNPVSGAWKGSVAGFLTGGPFGAMAGAVGGAAAGATLGTVKATTGWSYLSSDVKKNRNMQQTLDRVSYAKNMMDYQTTGNPESLEQASNTLTAFNTGKSQSLSNFLRAVNPKERPYLASFINVNDPKERKKILGMAPQEVGEGLQRAWNGMEGSPYMSHSGKEDMAAAQSLMSNRTQWEGFDPNVSMKDVKLSLIKNEGLECFVPSQSILTINGPVRIDSIVADYPLINALGEQQPVTKVHTKNISDMLLKIAFKGTFFDLQLTKNHFLPIAKKCSKYRFIERPAQDIKKYNRLQLCSYKFPESLQEIDGITLSPDLGYILGWYAAEGSPVIGTNGLPKGIVFSLGPHELNIANTLKSKIRAVFGVNTSIYVRKRADSDSSCIQVSAFGITMARFIVALIGRGSHNKRLAPQFLLAPLAFISSFVKGWWAGDGWRTSKEICVSTCSQVLAVQGWYLLRSCGMEATLQAVKGRKCGKEGHIISGPAYRIRVGRSQDKLAFDREVWQYTPYTTMTVSKVEEFYYDGPVYDIEMPDNHYYTTCCGTVHNSHDFGMGYAAQQRQHSNLFGGSTLNLSDPQGLMHSGNLSNIDNTTDIRRAIEETLRGRGGRGVVVTVTNLPGSSQNSLIINCTQDRTRDLITLLREPNV